MSSLSNQVPSPTPKDDKLYTQSELNESAASLFDHLVTFAQQCSVAIHRSHDNKGATIIDTGVKVAGNLHSAILFSRIGLSNHGSLSVDDIDLPYKNGTMRGVSLRLVDPVAPCLASQHPGWSIDIKDPRFSGIGFGPARALRGKEELLKKFQFSEKKGRGVLLIETDKVPDDRTIDILAKESNLQPSQISIAIARTGSLAALISYSARSIEITLRRLYNLGVSLKDITYARGQAPIPNPVKDNILALGQAHDSLRYGGEVALTTSSEQCYNELVALGPQITSSSVNNLHDKEFIEILKEKKFKLSDVAQEAFAPAMVNIRLWNGDKTVKKARFGYAEETRKKAYTVLERSFSRTKLD